MKKTAIVHVFFEVHMGAGHAKLQEILETKVKKGLAAGEYAAFINRSWTATKVLGTNGLMLYWRSPDGRAMQPETLRMLPTILGGQRFGFGGNHETRLINEYEKHFKNLREEIARVQA